MGSVGGYVGSVGGYGCGAGGYVHWDSLVYWTVAFVGHPKKNRLRLHLKKLSCMQFYL